MEQLTIKKGLPIAWADLAFQNRVLRTIATLALFVAALSSTAVLALLKRKPVIITLDTKANIVAESSPAPFELEVEKAARAYLGYRYVWQPENQLANLVSAKEFIAPQSLKAFEGATADLITFSKGKTISQRIYPTAITVTTKDNRVQITADRFNEIQGFKAASILQLGLIYQMGPRTTPNPWGIYFVKEEEAQ